MWIRKDLAAGFVYVVVGREVGRNVERASECVGQENHGACLDFLFLPVG